MEHANAVAVLTPADMLAAGQLNPEHRALLSFLANRTHATRSAYEMDLRLFSDWLREAAGVRSMLLCDRLMLKMYLEYLDKRVPALAQATISRRFGTVRLFLRHAYDEEILDQDPTRGTKPPKVDSDAQRRTWFETSEMQLVLRAAAKNPREHALIRFMLDTAIRVGELCSLEVEDLHLDPGAVWVGFVGKGNRQARVDLPFRTYSVVATYLDGRTTGPLFLNEWGNRITRKNVAVLIRKLAHEAGVNEDVTPHGLRRTHARSAVERGEDILGVSESLRHRDIGVTRRCYVGRQDARANMARQKVSDIFATS